MRGYNRKDPRRPPGSPEYFNPIMPPRTRYQNFREVFIYYIFKYVIDASLTD